MFNRHNTHFKAPPPAAASYSRSPSPPTSYIEPLSPNAVRPRPIEPSFYYPAVSHGQTWKAAQPESREPNVRKRGHHRVSSSIDTLADAALSIGTGNHTFAAHVGYGYTASDSPHKRARSEAYPAQFNVSQARPYTSHDPWSYAQHQTTYETRVEDAALLLNFSSTGGKSTPQHAYAESYQQSVFRPHANSMPSQPMPPLYYDYRSQRPPLPSPQRTSESKGPTPEALSDRAYDTKHNSVQPHQMHTPPEELEHFLQRKGKKDTAMAVPPKKRGWPKGKPRGPAVKKEPKLPVEKPVTKKAATRKKKPGKKGAALEVELRRRASFSDVQVCTAPMIHARSSSVPRDVQMLIRGPAKARRVAKKKDITICGGCHSQRESAAIGELDEWISCNGCKQWYHLDCAGFKRAVEVRDVDKYFCPPCEPVHGKTTYVRKSTRAHASVDYAELQKGVLRTGEESTEHHYIQPIKDGSFTFDSESFPRIRPELLTRDFFERSGAFIEPIVIPGEWNKRPWGATQPSADQEMLDAEVESHDDETLDPNFEYDTVLDEGQDQLDMIMPKGLTVRKVCHLVGPETPLDVIDVKTQNSGAKWNLARWADYYESTADDKPVRNVISLEVSQTKLGRLLRRPKVVRDIDLQDRVWPQEETERGKWPKVQYYCLMSIADSYTDFHIDFGGSSVYYHLIKGKKTFFFIPPKPKHLKAYEEWNDNPQQNFTFLPDITKECYRVDLSEGDTMLIPSGWIHAVWTPETSLVIGGNFLTHMNFKNQFKVAEIEKNNETPLKFRYPFFQRLMWYTALHYMQEDPLPTAVRELFLAGKQYDREQPIWQDFDDERSGHPGDYNARYYGQAELDGLPELSVFIFRTVMMTLGRVEGITADRMKRVHASIPKGHGEPLEIAKAFAHWVAWKRGNEVPPAWAHPDAPLPEMEEAVVKKLSARAIKELERREAVAKSSNDKVSKRAKKDQDRQTVKRESQERRPEQNKAAHQDDTIHQQHYGQQSLADGDRYLYQHQQYSTQNHQQYHAYQLPTQPMPPSQHDNHHHMPPILNSPIQLASSSNLVLASEPSADATTHLHASDATSSNFFIDNAKAAHTTTSSSYSSASSPPMFVHTSLHQDSMFAPSYDASSAPTMMMSAFHGQHISTPKTSVLGPKRVACDACRRRRIRCKHKDFVVQAIPEMSLQAMNAMGGNGASGDDVQSSLEAGTEDQITYDVNADGLSTPNVKLDGGARPGSLPGTNAYIDANIPMTLNGVALFGDPKRGRSKACLECRKSKRRCIHDEQGNVDPIKAAETPVPRTSTLDKKRESDETATNENKKAKTNNVGTLGVLKPVIKMASPVSDWSSASPHSEMMIHTPIDGSTPNSHASLPIDPSLMNGYTDDVFQYAHYAHALTRPPMVSLPSLEEIATEVLDFEGGAGNAGDEMDLAAIAQFNQSTNVQHETPAPAAEPDVSQTIAEVTAEPTTETIVEVAAETTATDSAANSTSPAEVDQAATADTSETTTRPRQDSIAEIPMYKPPASKSPELRRAQLETTVSRNARKAIAASPRAHTRNTSRTSMVQLNRESIGDALAV